MSKKEKRKNVSIGEKTKLNFCVKDAVIKMNYCKSNFENEQNNKRNGNIFLTLHVKQLLNASKKTINK